jgi:hypothetical protein
MDLGLSFTYVFQDEEWVKKILIGAVAFLILFIGWIPLLGWMIETTRRVIRQDPQPLPDWTDLGGLFSLGLKGLVIWIIAGILPAILVIPIAFLGATSNNSNTFMIVYSVCYSCFGIVYGILMALGLPASFGILAATDQLGDALNPNKIMGLVRTSPSAYLMALVGGFVAGIVGNLGTILCGIGVLATMAYSVAVIGHLYGQAYRQATTAAM